LPIFFLLSALLVIVVLAMLLPLLARREAVSAGIDRQQINVAIARTALEDLQTRVDEGELSNTEFELERQRLELDLAGDIQHGPEATHQAGGQWMLWPIAVLVPVVAGFLYLTIGTPAAILPGATQNPGQLQSADAQQPAPDMNDVVTRIQQRLAEAPDDARGWFMLGRAHMTLGQFDDAVVAIRRSLDLTGDEPEVLIRLADAIAMSQQGSMAGEPEPLLKRALALDPQNPQGLWLLGMAQSERGDNQTAIATWNQLLPLLAGDTRSETEVRQLIARAQQQLANASTATTGNEANQVPAGTGESVSATAPAATNADASTTTSSADSAGAEKLTVTVQLAAGIGEGLPAETPIFIYAKATQGPPMPLAVARRTLGDIPFTVTLSDADAMMPAMRLSQFQQVSVGARISLSGDAIARPGDLFGEMAIDAATGVENVTIKIADQVQ
jgi:cytochrome c-type biogenesis protein CcmH